MCSVKQFKVPWPCHITPAEAPLASHCRWQLLCSGSWWHPAALPLLLSVVIPSCSRFLCSSSYKLLTVPCVNLKSAGAWAFSILSSTERVKDIWIGLKCIFLSFRPSATCQCTCVVRWSRRRRSRFTLRSSRPAAVYSLDRESTSRSSSCPLRRSVHTACFGPEFEAKKQPKELFIIYWFEHLFSTCLKMSPKCFMVATRDLFSAASEAL